MSIADEAGQYLARLAIPEITGGPCEGCGAQNVVWYAPKRGTAGFYEVIGFRVERGTAEKLGKQILLVHGPERCRELKLALTQLPPI